MFHWRFPFRRRSEQCELIGKLRAAGVEAHGLFSTTEAMFSIDEGGGRALKILVSRGCDPFGVFFSASRAVVGKHGAIWIPVGIGLGEDRSALAASLEGGVDGLRAFMQGDPMPEPSVRAMTFALWQDEFFERELEVELSDGKGGYRALPVLLIAGDGRGAHETLVAADQAVTALAAVSPQGSTT